MRSVSGCKSESKITGCTLATIYPRFLDVVSEHQKDVSANVWGPICSPATARASDPLFGGGGVEQVPGVPGRQVVWEVPACSRVV